MSATKSQLQVLEDLVNNWLANGLDDVDIHKMVELVIQGHIKDGSFTEEYIKLAKLALDNRNKPSIILPN
jgi:hypothetical protein